MEKRFPGSHRRLSSEAMRQQNSSAAKQKIRE